MKKVNFIERKKGQIKIGLEIMMFKEDDSIIVYSAALNISSYGDTVEEAKKAFEHDLGLFLEYTTRKNTLDSELSRLGWKKVPRKKHKFQSPEFEELKKNNTLLDSIVANKQYDLVQQNYAIAV